MWFRQLRIVRTSSGRTVHEAILLPALSPLVIISVAILTLLAACSGDADGDTAPRTVTRDPSAEFVIEPGEPVIIGVSSALTGSAGERGRQYRNAVVVAVEEWKQLHGNTLGGHEIVVVAEDDGCTATDAAAHAARRHVERPGLAGVIGPQCSAGAAAAIPIYEEAGVIAISGSATSSTLTRGQTNRFFFRTAFRNDYQGVLSGAYASQFVEASTVWIVDDNEAYGLDLAQSIADVLEQIGIGVSRSSIAQGTVDFSALAAEIAAANPEMVSFAGFNPEAILLLRQLRDAGWTGAYAAGDAVCGSAECEFLAALGDTAEGTAFSGCAIPTSAEFGATFEAVHGDEATASFVPQYVDAARILLDALAIVAVERTDGSLVIDPDTLRANIAATTLSEGYSGTVQFDQNGDRTSVLLSASTPSVEDPETLTVLARALGLAPCFVQDGELVYFD